MDYLLETARALNLSKATVYKALTHNKFISYDTQKLVLQYFREHYPEQLEKRLEKASSSGVTNVTVVMPYKPSYFWDVAARGITDAVTCDDFRSSRISVRHCYYSSHFSGEELISLLDEVYGSLPDALIVVPINIQGVKDRLHRIAEKIPVVLFNEYCDDCEDLIRVIPDSFREGNEIGNMMAGVMRPGGTGLVLRNVENSKISEERISGVRGSSLIREKNIRLTVCDVEPEGIRELSDVEKEKYVINTMYPAKIARVISPILEASPDIEVVYTANGIMYQLIQAMRKLGRDDICVFGHETNPKVQAFFSRGFKGGYVSQDIYNEARTAADIVCGLLLDDCVYRPEVIRVKFDTYQFR